MGSLCYVRQLLTIWACLVSLLWCFFSLILDKEMTTTSKFIRDLLTCWTTRSVFGAYVLPVLPAVRDSRRYRAPCRVEVLNELGTGRYRLLSLLTLLRLPKALVAKHVLAWPSSSIALEFTLQFFQLIFWFLRSFTDTVVQITWEMPLLAANFTLTLLLLY